MTVPFRVGPESPKRPAQNDPFLEFESERPSRSLLGQQDAAKPSADLPPRPLVAPASTDRAAYDRPDRPDKSAISPTVAFAIGVAGLVTAAVGYYQMGQVLSDRSQPLAAAQGAGTAGTITATPAPPVVGRLEIASDPAGASVTLNGAAIGVTPLVLADVKPGRQEIVLTRGSASVTRTVDVGAGSTSFVTAVMSPAAAPAAAAAPSRDAATAGAANAGWVTFDSPIDLRVFERGRQRGSTRDRLAMAEGSYEFELVSDIYEVRQTVSARVGAARGTRVAVALPTGTLSINALPWADVWVDGSPVGTTPLANLTLKVGTHQVLLRHPTLGERQQNVVVKAVTPARLGVNLSR